MSFYSQLATTALSLITDKGQALELRRISATFDPITSTLSSPTKQTQTIHAVVVPFNKQDAANMDEKLLESLRAGKLRKLIVAADGLEYPPLPLDVLSLESVDWQVKGVTPLNPAGTPLIYYAIVEKGGVSAVQGAAVEA